jgi:hypothetical protein
MLLMLKGKISSAAGNRSFSVSPPSLDQTKSRKIAADLSASAGPDCEPAREIRQAKSNLAEYGRVAWSLEGSLEWVATQSLED